MNIYCPHFCCLYPSAWSACIVFPYADTVYDSACTHLSVRSCEGTGQQFCSQKYSIFLYVCGGVCVCVCRWLCLCVRVTLLASWLSLWRMLTGRIEPHWGRERQETRCCIKHTREIHASKPKHQLDKKYAKIMKLLLWPVRLKLNYIMTIYFSESRDSTDTVHISHKSLCVFVSVSVSLLQWVRFLSDIWMKRVIHFPTQTADTTPSLTITLSLLLPWCSPHSLLHLFFLSLHLSSSLPCLLCRSYTVVWHHSQALLHPVCICVCVCLQLKFPDAA